MKKALLMIAVLPVLLGGCTPLTQLEEVTAQSELTPRAIDTLLLIGVTGDDTLRRLYEAQCADSLAPAAEGYPKRIIASHEVFPDSDSLAPDTVTAWLDSNEQVDGILVLQLAAVTAHSGNLQPGGIQERFGVNLYQPGLTWNFQADPTQQLPEHQSALSQASLYLRPEKQLVVTVMTRTAVDDKVTRMADSHCDALRDALLEQGWL